MCQRDPDPYHECAQYYPENVGGEIELQDESRGFHLKLKTLEVIEEKWVTRRKIHLECSYGLEGNLFETTKSQEIEHIHFHSWPDMGAPTDPEAIDTLLDIADDLAKGLKSSYHINQ